jgi:hypothetical protein
METHERSHDHRDEPRLQPPGGDTPGSLDAVRQSGEEFLAAADLAIRRALSSDSEAFLRASRQQGGQ